MKKILSILLAILMTLSMFTICAYAQDETIIDKGTSGSNTEWTLSEDGVVNVFTTDGEINGKLNVSTFMSRSDIKEIIVSDTITYVDYCAIRWCSNLEKVYIGKNAVLYVDDWIERCPNLKEIEISPENERYCAIDNLVYDNVNDSWNWYTDMNIADVGFCGDNVAYYLTDDGHLTIEAVNGETNGKINEDAFKDPYAYRKEIKTVEIGDGIVTIGEDAFWYCDEITDVIVGSDVKYIDDSAFGSCYKLEAISLSEGLEVMHYPFSDCYSLRELTLPASLNEITMSYGTYELEKFNVDENNPHFKSVDGVLYSKDGKELLYYPNGKKDTEYTVLPGTEKVTELNYNYIIEKINLPDSLTELGEAAFAGCAFLKEINIPESLTSISAGAFAGCYSLEEITIPSGVTSIDGEAFAGCMALKTVNLPESLKSIGIGALSGCCSLKNIVIPAGVETIGRGAFEESNVLNITILSQNVEMSNCYLGTCFVEPENIDRYIEICYIYVQLAKDEITYRNDPEKIAQIQEEYERLAVELNGLYATDSDGRPVHLENQPTLINGYTGSTAEAYANENALTFVAIGSECEHISDEGTVTTQPTCSATGVKTYTCIGCGEVLRTETVAKLEHTSIVLAPVAPTCTNDGLTEGALCAVCGETLTQQTRVPATGHTDNDNDGWCDDCGKELHSHEEAPQTFIERIKAFFDRILDFFRNLFR